MSIHHVKAVVQTAYGDLEGTQDGNLRIFRGVPYAKPPVGERRFRSPAPLEPWNGTRSALQSGQASCQMNSANEAAVLSAIREMDPGVPGIPSWPSYVGKTYDHPHAGEDCLYLDIWAPEVRAGQKLPVYLYYHGGANAVSSGAFELERGANLAAQEDIIVVRPNYRLGALGWVHFGLISDEFPEAINLGLQDQIAALEWVAANIDAFGGDKDNITIGGESCGATAVSHLMTHPRTRTLFKRAILQSLSPFNLWCPQGREQAAEVARTYLELLGIKDPAELLHVEPNRLLAVQNILTRYLDPDDNVAWRPLGGVVDGEWIARQPAEMLSSTDYPRSGMQLMIGFAKDEWQFFRGHSETIRRGSRDNALRVLEQVYGEKNAAALFSAFETIHPTHAPGHLLSDIMAFEFFKFSSLLIAQNFAKQGIPAYVFQFSYDLPGWNGELRAVHTGDMPFLWRNFTPEDLARWPSFEGAETAEIERTAKEMGRLYAEFIRNGNPGPAWRSYDERSRTVLSFGKAVTAIDGLMDAEFQAFTSHGAKTVQPLETALVRSLKAALARQNAGRA